MNKMTVTAAALLTTLVLGAAWFLNTRQQAAWESQDLRDAPTVAENTQGYTGDSAAEEDTAFNHEEQDSDKALEEALAQAIAAMIGSESKSGLFQSASPSGGAKRAAPNAQPAVEDGKAADAGRTRGTRGRETQEGSAGAHRTGRDRSNRTIAKARAAIAQGDYEQAISLLQQSIQEDPTNAQSYRTLADLYRSLGMTAEELQTYQEWAAVLPDQGLPHYFLASAYERQGLNEQALAELTLFGQLSQDNVSAYPMSASLYRRLGMRAEEGQVLQAWAETTPNSPDAHSALADYYRRMGYYDAAIAEYQRVTALTPGNVSARLNLAAEYQRLGQYPSAQAELLTAVELRPADMTIRMRLAESYRRSGAVPAAVQTYQSVIDLKPGSREAERAARAIARIEQQQRGPSPKSTQNQPPG